jgi:hypothetical protein
MGGRARSHPPAGVRAHPAQPAGGCHYDHDRVQDQLSAPTPVGSVVTGECLPLHRGRRTMVWQTRLTGIEGRLLALVTQTQMVLPPA